MGDYAKGAEWRRWDLHIHTPGTNKNDQFKGGDLDAKWEVFCSDINNYDGDVSVVGVTDYWSIENYFIFKEKLESGDITKNIDLVIPNVEMRVTPVTSKGKPINIHCLFNPKIEQELDERFFQKVRIPSGRGFSATRKDLIHFGRYFQGDDQLAEDAAYKVGVENFVVDWSKIKELFEADPILRSNTIVAVSNSSQDGASGIVRHSDYFSIGGKWSQLEPHRREIYKLSDAIFSSNEKDVRFFYGEAPEYTSRCGSPKPCIHGSDAHTNNKIFEPNDNKYCWIKADPTFEGLKQTLNEPEDRVFIGVEPPVFSSFKENKTKYIKALTIVPVESYKKEQGAWFDGVRLSFNNQLVAIIGNKGSGKSAIADILALCGETSTPLEFLTKKKFKKNGLAAKFEATMYWQDNTDYPKNLADDINHTAQERVKYLSQSYFEVLCSEIDHIEKFRKELEGVVFSHIPHSKRYGCNNFTELVAQLKGDSIIESSNQISKLQQINSAIKNLEIQRNSSFYELLESKEKLKQQELDAHDSVIPDEVENPSAKEKEESDQATNEVESTKAEIASISEQVEELEADLLKLSIDIEKLGQIREKIEIQEKALKQVKADISTELGQYGIPTDEVIDVNFHYKLLDEKVISFQTHEVTIKNKLDGFEETKGLRDTLAQLNEKSAKLLEELGAPQKRYQKYLSDMDIWKAKRLEIEGDASKPESLEGLKQQKVYIKGGLLTELESLRVERESVVEGIFEIKFKLIDVYKHIKESIDQALTDNHDLLGRYDVSIKSCFEFNENFISRFLAFIDQKKKGSFSGKEAGQLTLKGMTESVDPSCIVSVNRFLKQVTEYLEADYRDINKKETRYIDDQVKDITGLYNYLFSLEYLVESYSLEMGGKHLQQLSPGEKGALLLIFYLLLDKDNKPLIIDQPEDNLDNQSVSRILVPFIKKAKERRQIFMVTHNPNLAVVADAEQVIHVNIAKDKDNRVSANPGAIESPEINRAIVNILEGTMPAFRQRDMKYLR